MHVKPKELLGYKGCEYHHRPGPNTGHDCIHTLCEAGARSSLYGSLAF